MASSERIPAACHIIGGVHNDLTKDDQLREYAGAVPRRHTVQSGSGPVLEPAAWPLWLGEVAGDYAALLRTAPVGTVRLWRVSQAVNSERNSGPELLTKEIDVAPLAPAEMVGSVKPANRSVRCGLDTTHRRVCLLISFRQLTENSACAPL